MDPHNSFPKVQAQENVVCGSGLSSLFVRHYFVFPQRLKISSYGVRCYSRACNPLVKRGQQKEPSLLPIENGVATHEPSSAARWSTGCLFYHLELPSPLFSTDSKPDPSQRLSSGSSSSTKPFPTGPEHNDLSRLCIPIIISVPSLVYVVCIPCYLIQACLPRSDLKISTFRAGVMPLATECSAFHLVGAQKPQELTELL